MKKTLLLFSICTAIILLTNYATTTTVRTLELPEVVYDYSVEIPSFLLDPQGDGGYVTSGIIDEDKLDFIDNDIATLGRVLFYDEMLSGTQDLACANCHLQENSFAEPLQFSEGSMMETQSNSMHLNDLGWSNDGFFLWDMHMTELREVVKVPFTLSNENGLSEEMLVDRINELGYYEDLFFNAYDDSTPSLEKVSEALTQFISSINTFNSKFDIASENGFNNLSNEELQGMQLFNQNCSICHTQGSLSLIDIPVLDAFFFSNGIELDAGDIGAGSWSPEMSGSFKKTTLRNWKYTAPYMHNGSMATMEEVLDHYGSDDNDNAEWNNNIFLPIHPLTEFEKTNLMAFLEMLNDETLLENDKWSDPFKVTTHVQDDNQLVLNADVYPNPTDGMVNIEYPNPGRSSALVEVYESTGRKVHHSFSNEEIVSIQTSNLHAGRYIIRVTLDGELYNGSFVRSE